MSVSFATPVAAQASIRAKAAVQLNSTSARPRCVAHLEFSPAELPDGLQWRERLELLEESKKAELAAASPEAAA